MKHSKQLCFFISTIKRNNEKRPQQGEPKTAELPPILEKKAQVDLPVPTETDETAEEAISCWGEGRYEDGENL